MIIGIVSSASAFKWVCVSSKFKNSTTDINFSLVWLSLLGVYFNWACEATGMNDYRQAGIYSAQFVYAICILILVSSLFASRGFHEFLESIKIVLFLMFLLLLGDGISMSISLSLVANIVWQSNCESYGKVLNTVSLDRRGFRFNNQWSLLFPFKQSPILCIRPSRNIRLNSLECGHVQIH